MLLPHYLSSNKIIIEWKMKKRYDNKSTAKEYMEYVYDVSILGKWWIKVWMISRRIKSVYDYKVIKCNFIWKGRFKIRVLLLSQR